MEKQFNGHIRYGKENCDIGYRHHYRALDNCNPAFDAKVQMRRMSRIKICINHRDCFGTSGKYDELLAEYNKYKSDVEARETQRNAETAYRQLLVESGVSEKRLDAILRVTDLSKITLDADGKVKDAETLKANIQSEWSDFIVKQGEVGASTPEPPTQNNPTMFNEMSLADKMAYANANPNAAEVVSWLKGES